MGKTALQIPIDTLPDSFFVEELSCLEPQELEELLDNPPEKIPNCAITVQYECWNSTEWEQIKAHATPNQIRRALRLSREYQ